MCWLKLVAAGCHTPWIGKELLRLSTSFNIKSERKLVSNDQIMHTNLLTTVVSMKRNHAAFFLCLIRPRGNETHVMLVI